MKRLWKGISIAVAFSLILGTIAYAYSFYIDYQVKETAGTSYTMLPVYGVANNANYAATGMISATGLNTRVYDADNSTAPHMLTTDKTWFTIPVPGNNTKIVRYALGESPALTSFKIIPGYSGNITVADNSTLELGAIFDISISGYFSTATSGSTQSILYKQGAAKLNVSAAGTITFHALNADDSDNWTMQAPLSSGNHTIRTVGDGLSAYLYVDGSLEDAESLITKNLFTAVGSLTTLYYAPGNHATFYSDGLYWVFFIHDAGGGKFINYITSPDGTTWSAKTAITAGTSITQNTLWSTWFDGTSFYYVFKIDATHIAFRKGAPQSDGSITWAAVEQTVAVAPGNTMYWPSVAVASDGHAQIAYQENVGAAQYIKSVRNDNTDGTWSTTGGYPVTIFSAGAATTMALTLIADYDSDKMYCFTGRTSDSYVRGYYFNGTSWSGTIDNWGSASSPYPIGVSGAFENDDDIVGTWLNGATSYLFNVRYSGGTMGTASSFGTVENNAEPSLTFDTVTGKTYLFWIDGTSDDMYFKTYTDGTWGSDTLVAAGTLDRGLSSPVYKFPGDNIGIANDFNSSIYHAYLRWDWAWLDNANIWWWMLNNTMSYSDNITLDTLGIRRMTFKPAAIISGTTLVDESGNGQNGTFNWGGIPAGVLVTAIAYGTGATPSIPRQPTGFVMPAFPIPQSWFNVGKDLSGLPFYDSFAAVSAQTGQPVQVMYFLLILGLAFGAFLIAIMFTRLAIFGVLCFNIVMFFGAQQGVVPSWMIFAIGIIQVAILYLYKQVAY